MQKTAYGGLLFHTVSSDWDVTWLPAQMMRVMRLLTVFLFAASLAVSARPAAQTVTLSGKDLTLGEVFSAVEKQTGYLVLGNKAVFRSRKHLSLSVNNLPLHDFLGVVLKDQPVKYQIAGKTIFLSEKSHVSSDPHVPQPPTQEVAPPITGVVRDAGGNPLQGASITVKGTNIGTSTDVNGRFNIDANSGQVLLISFTGYQEKELTITSAVVTSSNQQSFTIALLVAETAMEDIVVVGASVKKKDITGAVVNIDEKVLEERPVTSIAEALQGRAAGVFIQDNPQPGGEATIRVRGNNSLQYGGNPIFVVDGIVMEGDFNLTNLNDVASVTVLKDASATALYGSRGANGVVVVTTKRGKKGQGQVSYKSWIGIEEFTNANLNLGAQDVYNLRIDALANSHVAENYFALNPNATREQFINDELLRTNSNWFADYEKETYAAGKSYDWLKAISRSGFQQNHTLSFSGGSERNTYYLSFGYIDQKGLIQGSSNKRYTGRINAEQEIKPWLKIGTNTFLTKSVSDEVDRAVFAVAQESNPLLPIDRYKDTLFLAWGNSWDINRENPFNTLKIDKDRNRVKIASSNYVEINPIRGLKFRSTFAIDNVTQEYYEYVPSDIQQAFRDSYKGRAIHNLDYSNYFQWDNSITYDASIRNHQISALVSTSLSKNDFHFTNVLARDFPIDDFRYYNLGSAYDRPNFNLGSDKSVSSLESYLARVNYNYGNKYFVTLTGRYDGSSRFADGHKWGFFPSIAFSWNVVNEEFMKGQQLFDLMKLRLGYGSVGNQGIPNYAFYSLYNPVYSGGSVSFVSSGLRGTPNLKWEKQDQFNIGLDLAMFNNRLSLTADYFHIANSNLLMRRTLSAISGYNSTIENIGELTNRGVELAITGVVLDKKDLYWDISVNFSKDKNEITKLYQGVDAIYNFGGFTGADIQKTGNFFLGESLNTIYMLEFDRIIQQKDMDYVNSLQLPGKTLQPGDMLPKDQQSDGVIDANDRVIVGTQDPKFYGGFSTKLVWKNLELNSVFSYSYGAKKISTYYERLMTGTGFWPAHKDNLDRWTPTNTDTDIPRVTYDNAQRFGANETSWGLQDASFLRLSTITLSYNMPDTYIKKVGLSNLRLYASGNNVFTWTKYKGYDPENGDWYPTARMFVAGINLTF
ncbi:MAG TPA: TonB-dependent receptor [Flavitalea sp.]|nr:TonB-dependent receptor [Flavitalea sp.]